MGRNRLLIPVESIVPSKPILVVFVHQYRVGVIVLGIMTVSSKYDPDMHFAHLDAHKLLSYCTCDFIALLEMKREKRPSVLSLRLYKCMQIQAIRRFEIPPHLTLHTRKHSRPRWKAKA